MKKRVTSKVVESRFFESLFYCTLRNVYYGLALNAFAFLLSASDTSDNGLPLLLTISQHRISRYSSFLSHTEQSSPYVAEQVSSAFLIKVLMLMNLYLDWNRFVKGLSLLSM